MLPPRPHRYTDTAPKTEEAPGLNSTLGFVNFFLSFMAALRPEATHRPGSCDVEHDVGHLSREQAMANPGGVIVDIQRVEEQPAKWPRLAFRGVLHSAQWCRWPPPRQTGLSLGWFCREKLPPPFDRDERVPLGDQVADIAHKHGVPLIVDNTTATPYLVRPFEHQAPRVKWSLWEWEEGGG